MKQRLGYSEEFLSDLSTRVLRWATCPMASSSITVDGVELAESAAEIGVALETLDADFGLIWVLVNVQ